MADDAGSRRSGWRPALLTCVMGVLALWCAVAGWIGLHLHVTSSDPAGNGMATALVRGFAEAGLEATVILVGLYLLCRWKPVRYTCVTLLVFLSLGMIIIVR